jgi:hypothetical protein
MKVSIIVVMVARKRNCTQQSMQLSQSYDIIN